MNTLALLQSEIFRGVENIGTEEEPLFSAIDCAKALGYSNPHDAILRHCKKVKKRKAVVVTGKKKDGSDAVQSVMKSYIGEPDLYRLLLNSKLVKAREFESKIFDEVLPNIREHGSSFVPRSLNEFDFSSLEGIEEALEYFEKQQKFIEKYIQSQNTR